MNEEAAAVDYLKDYLESDATLSSLLAGGVWSYMKPQSVPTPIVKLDRQDATDLYVVNLHRVWADLTYLVRGIMKWDGAGQEDWTRVREIGDRIDALLHDHEDLTSELEVHSFREESFQDMTLESGDRYLHVGGIYRLRARAV